MAKAESDRLVVEVAPHYAERPLVLAHRGTAVLVLGILGVAACFIFGVIAWVMGSSDLREMDAHIMDSSGRGLTQAGTTCGILSVIMVGLWAAGASVTMIASAIGIMF